MQKIILIGNIGQDAVIRSVNAERDALSFSLATNEAWLDKDGKEVSHTEWHDVVLYGKKGRFNKMAEMGMVSAGRKVYVEGVVRKKLSEPNAEGKQFLNVSVVVDPRNIQFLGGKPEAAK